MFHFSLEWSPMGLRALALSSSQDWYMRNLITQHMQSRWLLEVYLFTVLCTNGSGTYLLGHSRPPQVIAQVVGQSPIHQMECMQGVHTLPKLLLKAGAATNNP